MQILITVFFILAWWVSGADAACSGASPSWTAASPAQTDVQGCVNAATDGDTINVPAGPATWTSPVTWTNKAIAVIGAGIDQTVITIINNSAFAIMINAGANYT